MNRDHLDQISRELDTLCARTIRRAAQPAATNADSHMNNIMTHTLIPVRDAVSAYRDFYQAHEGADGLIPGTEREAYFDFIVSIADAVQGLDRLAGDKMNRTSTAPGSLQRLSPLFLGVVIRERTVIDRLKANLQAVMGDDLAVLKTMKRAGERERGLRLVYSANGV